MPFDRSGSVDFAVGSEQHRFDFRVTTTAEDKLRIWIKDMITKEQWQSQDLDVGELVRFETETASDIVTANACQIATCLTHGPTKHDTHVSFLSPTDTSNGSRMLFVSFSVKAREAVSTVNYTFSLAAMPLDKVDILQWRVTDLEATLADQQGQIKALTQEVKDKGEQIQELTKANKQRVIEAAIARAFRCAMNHVFRPVDATLKRDAVGPQALVWDFREDSAIVSTMDNGELVFKAAGLYMLIVHVVVSGIEEGKRPFRVLHNDVPVTCKVNFQLDSSNSEPGPIVVGVEEGDRVSIVYTGKFSVLVRGGTSILSLVYLDAANGRIDSWSCKERRASSPW